MQGTVYRVVELLEERHSSFLVARVILLTGIRLRDYEPTTPDDPTVLRALGNALQRVLSEDELRPIQALLQGFDRTPRP